MSGGWSQAEYERILFLINQMRRRGYEAEAVPDGSLTEPAIYFMVDEDTGLYRPADGQIALSSNGAQVARFGRSNHLAGYGKLDANYDIGYYMGGGSGSPPHGVRYASYGRGGTGNIDGGNAEGGNAGLTVAGGASGDGYDSGAGAGIVAIGGSGLNWGTGGAGLFAIGGPNGGQITVPTYGWKPNANAIACMGVLQVYGGDGREAGLIVTGAGGIHNGMTHPNFGIEAWSKLIVTSNGQNGFGFINYSGTNPNTGSNCQFFHNGVGARVYTSLGYMRLNSPSGTLILDAADGTYMPVHASSYPGPSSRRIKRNIVDLGAALAKLKQLRPVTYSYAWDTTTRSGLIAEEAAPIIPESMHTMPDPNGVEGETIQGIDYGSLVPLLIKAVQEQQVQIDALNARLFAAESKLPR